jgi:ferredoxin-NADP reductase
MTGSTGWQGYRNFRVERKEPESETVTSFYLAPEDGGDVASYEPGQFLGFELDVPGHDKPVIRTYTISEAPGRLQGYRLSIKREPSPPGKPDLPPGVSSNYFHDHVDVGSVLRVRAPAGDFYLDRSKQTPVVLLSGGVGLTPMISMLNSIVDDGAKRSAWFIHAVRNRKEHAFGSHVRGLANAHDNVQAHIRYDDVVSVDVLGRNYDGQGFITAELIKDIIGGAEADIYLCGPPPFMKALFNDLLNSGVTEDRIHYEFFGPVQDLHEVPPTSAAPAAKDVAAPAAASEEKFQITFRRSEKTATWDPAMESLLEFAESLGLDPDFSCRSGFCHTCLTTLIEGEVEYIDDAVMVPNEEDEVLICSSRPKSDVILDV